MHPDKLSKLITLQRRWRSKRRYRLHDSTFYRPPRQLLYLKTVGTNPRFTSLINQLSAQHAVIHSKVFHWTSEANFKSIAERQAFYGNKSLKKFNISFTKNALCDADEENGDGNVICLSPFLVDPVVLMNKGKAAMFQSEKVRDTPVYRDKLVQLTLDLTKLPRRLDDYNQFFKCYDLMGPPFSYAIKINAALEMKFYKTDRLLGSLNIELCLNKQTITVSLQKRDVIFYGNLAAINRFCLLMFFKLISLIPSEVTRREFMDYLNSLDDAELTKILIVAAQGLTLYAEYNFNAVLALNQGLLSEVYLHEDRRTYSLATLPLQDYHKIVDDKPFAINFMTATAPPLHIIDPVHKELTLHDIRVSGVRVRAVYDFSIIPAAAFVSPHYRETRNGPARFTFPSPAVAISPNIKTP